MIVNKYGRVAGSIDLATLAELYVQATDDDLKAHYREVAAENGADFGEVEAPAVEESAKEEPVEDDLDVLRTEAEAAGVKVDKRWGVDRLYEEIEKAEAN